MTEPHRNPRPNPTKFTVPLRQKFVELIAEGQLYKSVCAALHIDYTTYSHIMAEGKDERNKWQASFRKAIKHARSQAEFALVRNIKLAGIDQKHWQANAWLLQHSIQGHWQKSAKDLNPNINISMKEIAQKLDQAEAESDSDTDY